TEPGTPWDSSCCPMGPCPKLVMGTEAKPDAACIPSSTKLSKARFERKTHQLTNSTKMASPFFGVGGGRHGLSTRKHTPLFATAATWNGTRTTTAEASMSIHRGGVGSLTEGSIVINKMTLTVSTRNHASPTVSSIFRNRTTISAATYPYC